MKKSKKKNKKEEFSKFLLKQESILVWIVTLVVLCLSFLCVLRDSSNSLPWLTTLITVVWTAYGASQAFYYNKAKAENTKNGVKYETVLAELTTNNNKEEIDIDYGI